jgi:hypothetical protein
MRENRETSIVPADSAGRTAKAQSHKAGTHAMEESDCGEVPMNQSNKGEQAPAEVGEGRLRPEENTGQSHTPPAQNGQRVSQGLNGVRRAARERKQERFTTLLHHLNVNLLRAATSHYNGKLRRVWTTGGPDSGSPQPDSPGSVPRTALAKSLYTEGRREATPVG